MKKLAFLLAFVILVSMPLEANAVARITPASPKLTFSGSTAICDVSVTGNIASDYITVTMTLKLGDNYITSWTESGYGYVYMKKNTSVGVGSTYTLIVDITINGVAYDPISVEKTCWP